MMTSLRYKDVHKYIKMTKTTKTSVLIYANSLILYFYFDNTSIICRKVKINTILAANIFYEMKFESFNNVFKCHGERYPSCVISNSNIKI